MSDIDSEGKTQVFVPLTAGIMVSHYRIIEKIGAGGMGEVYLAEDTKLDRKVALKFLPHHLCQLDECRARFTREAQAAAKLDHPNIVGVHEVGEYNGRPFFSMQLVEGQTLREVIKGKPLALDRILEIAIQACDGLQAAHEKGVTHRDIKPSNLLLDSHGRVRIVDFGLASVLGTDQLTKTGSTLGTVGYMSPEQVNGEKVDHRTDLFSMGVVLYELLTGQSPFKCDSEAATLHAITNTKPELLARFRRELPPELQTIIDKALDKNVATRYQHADDLTADLKRMLAAVSQQSRVPEGSLSVATRKRWPVTAAVGVAVVVFLAIAWLWRGSGDRRVSPTLAKQKQITFSGDIQLVDISPDGSKLAFVRGELGSLSGLYTYSLAGGDPLLIFQGGLLDIAWSPDGNAVLAAGVNAKDTAMGVFLIPYMGGDPRRFRVGLCAPCKVSWDPGGTAFYYHESCAGPGRFLKIDVKTGDTVAYPMNMPVKWVLGMAASPDGHRLLFDVESDSGSALWTAQTDGSDARILLDLPTWGESRICWSPDSRAVYLIRNEYESLELVQQRIDSRTGKALGFPQVLLSGLDFSGPISTSQQSTTLAYRRRAKSSTLKLWSRREANGKTEYIHDVIGTSTSASWAPRFSPDGSKAAYVTDINFRGHLRILNLQDRTTRDLDIAGRDIANFAWSPDGKTMAILYWDRAAVRLCLADASTGSVLPLPQNWTDLTFSRQISWAPLDILIVQVPGNRNFYKLDPRAGTVGRLIANDSVGWIFDPAPSVQGEIATDWNRQADSEGNIWLISVDGSHQVQMTGLKDFGLGTPLNWSADGSQLCWRSDHGYLFRSSHDGTANDTILRLGADSLASIAITPDAKYIFGVLSETKTDVWVIENFDPETK